MSDEWRESGDSGSTVTLPPSEAVAEPQPEQDSDGALHLDGAPHLDGEAVCGTVGSEGQRPATVQLAPVQFEVEPPAQAPAAAVTVGTIGRAWQALVQAVGDELDGRERLWVLEAGAGTRTLFDLPEDAYIVGVDRDPRALESNVRLDERVVAELSNYRPLAAGFDLITCWYVVDGVEDPARLLDRFAAWTAHDGLVVLAVPNLRSPRGLAQRFTGRATLGRPVTPGALRRRFAGHGFTPILQVYFEDADQVSRRRQIKLTQGRWKAVQALVRVLSLGLLDAARTDYIAVFRRDR